MAKKASLLWIDLEMTGLDPVRDRILEIGAIATDWEFNRIAEMTAVVKVDPKLIAERMVGEFWEKNRESYEGLVAQNASGLPSAEVEKQVLAFMDKHFRKTIYLAGNSIHQDRKFIDREWPQVSERLHYRMLDVSAWKVYFENARGVKFLKRDAHRALDDINGSIEELEYYTRFLKEGRLR